MSAMTNKARRDLVRREVLREALVNLGHNPNEINGMPEDTLNAMLEEQNSDKLESALVSMAANHRHGIHECHRKREIALLLEQVRLTKPLKQVPHLYSSCRTPYLLRAAADICKYMIEDSKSGMIFIHQGFEFTIRKI